MTARIRAVWLRLPLAARKIVVDFVETFIGLAGALTFVIPGTLEEAKAQAVLVWGAVIAAAVSSFRRGWPGIVLWLRTTFTVVLALLTRAAR